MVVACMITIDTTEKIGASEVYGVSELTRVLQEGCKVLGYKFNSDNYVDDGVETILAYVGRAA
jgi:hypothetical protein